MECLSIVVSLFLYDKMQVTYLGQEYHSSDSVPFLMHFLWRHMISISPNTGGVKFDQLVKMV